MKKKKKKKVCCWCHGTGKAYPPEEAIGTYGKRLNGPFPCPYGCKPNEK